MSQFIESLRIQNSEILLAAMHQRRFNLTRLAHYGWLAPIDLQAEVATFLASQPIEYINALCKVRVTFSRQIENIEVEHYTRRNVSTIKLVDAPSINYRYKYADRSALNTLRDNVQPGTEPVIVQHGFVTDAIYANVCVFDGVRWLTPERPLLEGVARAAALAAGDILPAPIRARDFEQGRYKKLRLINCMNWFSEAVDIELPTRAS